MSSTHYALAVLLLLAVTMSGIRPAQAGVLPQLQQVSAINDDTKDLQTSATSAKLLNWGSLLGQHNYGYGYGNSFGNTYRPSYYPNTGGYYGNSGGFYGTSSSYYPSSSGSYPSNSGYYPTSYGYNGPSAFYPSSSYYPSSGPAYSTTNILGRNGGYGGYGGNGGLRQYYGYWQPNYSGQRNRGYGYTLDTDCYGLGVE